MNSLIHSVVVAGDSDVTSEARAALRTLIAAGAPANTTTLAQAESLPGVHKPVITLTAFPVTVANTTGISFGGAKYYDFPAGGIMHLGATANFTAINWAGQDIAAAGSGDFSLGTTITADGTLATTEVNLLPSSAMLDPFVASVGTGVGVSTAVAFADGTTTAVDANLNVIIDDADVADGASDVVLFTGTITHYWINLGDY